MKNLKLFFALFSVIVISGFIYFSAEGFSRVPSAAENKSTVVTVNVQVYGTELCFGSGSLKYCINGGGLMYFPTDGKIQLECNTNVIICVIAETGCCGSWSGQINCDDIAPPYTIPITISANTECCICA